MKKIYLSQSGTVNRGKFCWVNDDLYEFLNQYSWQYDSDGYARREETINKEKKVIWMHRLIFELKVGDIPEGMKVDHINKDSLCNCIENLRLATNQENCFNQSLSKASNSGYKGVSYLPIIDDRFNPPYQYEHWHSEIRITIGGKRKTYGKDFPFTEEGKIQAALWYDDKAIELFGKYASLNFPDETTRPKKKTIAEIDISKPKSKSGIWGVKKVKMGKKLYWEAGVNKDSIYYSKRFPFTDEGKLEAACYFDLKAKQLYGKDVKHLNFPLGIPLQVTLEELEEIPRPKSGYFGVSKVKNGGCNPVWLVRIRPKGKKTYTKTFPFTEEGLLEAAHHYDDKAKELLGDKAKRLNFPDDK